MTGIHSRRDILQGPLFHSEAMSASKTRSETSGLLTPSYQSEGRVLPYFPAKRSVAGLSVNLVLQLPNSKLFINNNYYYLKKTLSCQHQVIPKMTHWPDSLLLLCRHKWVSPITLHLPALGLRFQVVPRPPTLQPT